MKSYLVSKTETPFFDAITSETIFEALTIVINKHDLELNSVNAIYSKDGPTKTETLSATYRDCENKADHIIIKSA